VKQVSSLSKKRRCEERRGERGETTSSRVPFCRSPNQTYQAFGKKPTEQNMESGGSEKA
jgi:hypothetical protein